MPLPNPLVGISLVLGMSATSWQMISEIQAGAKRPSSWAPACMLSSGENAIGIAWSDSKVASLCHSRNLYITFASAFIDYGSRNDLTRDLHEAGESLLETGEKTSSIASFRQNPMVCKAQLDARRESFMQSHCPTVLSLFRGEAPHFEHLVLHPGLSRT